MPVMHQYEPGTPSWVDLGTPDPQAAADFYAAVFGWDIEDLGEQAGHYRMARLDGRAVCGIGPQMNENMPAWWTTYITVAEVDRTAEQIPAAGGQVLMAPMDVMDAGRMLVATDNGGAAFACWQPGASIGSEIVNEVNTLCWNELTTRAGDAAVEFYEAVFGWGAQRSDDGHLDYTEWQLGGASIGGMMRMDENWPAEIPNHWLVYFRVADADATCERITSLGGSVKMPPMDIPPGRFAVAEDNQGAIFAILRFAEA